MVGPGRLRRVDHGWRFVRIRKRYGTAQVIQKPRQAEVEPAKAILREAANPNLGARTGSAGRPRGNGPPGDEAGRGLALTRDVRASDASSLRSHASPTTTPPRSLGGVVREPWGRSRLQPTGE